jgi:DDE superfamily endonuclease
VVWPPLDHLWVPPQISKTKAVAAGVSVQQSRGLGEQARSARLDDLAVFRCVFYDCLTLRADAVLCAGGPVATLVGLSLAAEHRRGHGGLYDGLGSGRIEVDRLRRSLVNLLVPRDAQGHYELAADAPPKVRVAAAFDELAQAV